VVNANRFRVVDASDGLPIAGVSAEGSYDFPIGLFTIKHFGPNYATSDATGLVQFDELGQQEVAFEKEGYKPCTVVAGWPGYRRRNTLVSLRTFPWEDEWTPIIQLQPRK
jgi:hypothetical protein